MSQLDPSRPDLTARLYLGDGAYVGMSQWGDVDLWTTDGIRVTNRIVLEGPVLHALVDWIRTNTSIE